MKTSIFYTPSIPSKFLTSPILHMHVEAWVSVMADMQSLPLYVVSSPFHDPCVLTFIDNEVEVSFFNFFSFSF